MLRGVPVDNSLTTDRLIDWYYREQTAEINKTMLLVAALKDGVDLQDFIKKYIDSVIPSGKANDLFVEQNAEILKAESLKSYSVKSKLKS